MYRQGLFKESPRLFVPALCQSYVALQTHQRSDSIRVIKDWQKLIYLSFGVIIFFAFMSSSYKSDFVSPIPGREQWAP